MIHIQNWSILLYPNEATETKLTMLTDRRSRPAVQIQPGPPSSPGHHVEWRGRRRGDLGFLTVGGGCVGEL